MVTTDGREIGYFLRNRQPQLYDGVSKGEEAGK